MGVVYLAEHEPLKRKAALKVIAPEFSESEEFRGRFLNEARLIATVPHPSIVTVYDAGETADGSLFLAMRYIEGGDIKRALAREGAFRPERALQMSLQISQALEAAHRRGLVHRDVKPGNILVYSGDSQGERFLLTDFGLAITADQIVQLSRTGQAVGTVDYMAPEQIKGDPVDHRCDIYALGCVLFQYLTGKTPFQGNEVAGMWAQIHTPPPRLSDESPDLPVELDRIIADTMNKNPDRRYATAAELADDLDGLIEAQASRAMNKESGARYSTAGTLTTRSARLRRLGGRVQRAGAAWRSERTWRSQPFSRSW